MQASSYNVYISRMLWKGQPQKGDSPVDKNVYVVIYLLPSTMEHVKFRGNLPRPWGKAKYYLMTDSAQVP